jgi:hypothetical protein
MWYANDVDNIVTARRRFCMDHLRWMDSEGTRDNFEFFEIGELLMGSMKSGSERALLILPRETSRMKPSSFLVSVVP